LFKSGVLVKLWLLLRLRQQRSARLLWSRAAVPAPKGICRQSQEKSQRWEKHHVQIPDHGGKTDGPEQHHQNRRETAKRGYDGARYSVFEQPAVRF
jgi:hypothetical protein